MSQSNVSGVLDTRNGTNQNEISEILHMMVLGSGNVTNETAQNETSDRLLPSMPISVIVCLSLLNAVIFLVGIIGNICVISVVSFVKDLRSPINLFFVNLSVSDVLVLVVCQLSALTEFYANDQWLLGETMCKMTYFLENAANHTSILTVLAISIERYKAICQPLARRFTLSFSKTIYSLLLIWIIAYAVSTPFLLMTSQEVANNVVSGTSVFVCRSKITKVWHHVFVFLTIIVFFIAPVMILTLLYTISIRELSRDKTELQQSSAHFVDDAFDVIRNKRRQTIHMLIAIVLLFSLCLLPSRVLILWSIYTPVEEVEKLGLVGYTAVVWFARLMLYLNSAGNPIIYNILSSRFQNALNTLLLRARGRKRARFGDHPANFKKTRRMTMMAF